MKLNNVAILWYGSEESYFTVVRAEEQLQALQAQGMDAVKAAVMTFGGGRGDDPFALPPLWENQGGVGVLSIKGSLISGTAGFYRLFGVLGYQDIQEALVQMVSDKSVKSVLLDIDSGGGMVDGVEDAGEMVQQVGKLKPTSTYTGGAMGSAAYWLGSSADTLLAAKTSTVGSVGTLIVHMERSQQLKDSGIAAKVIRYGKYKALGNPIEPLTKEAEEHLQAMADEAGKIFVEYVSARRGVTPEKFQATMGEGRVFMGRKALEVGLIDGVSNFNSALESAKSLDKSKAHPQNPRNLKQDRPMKATLASALILAIMGGAGLTGLDLKAVTSNSQGIEPDAETLASLTAEATKLVEARDAGIKTATDKAVAEVTVKLNASQAEVASLQTKLTVAEAAASNLTGKVTESNELAAKQAGIVKASIGVMAVALGVADTGPTLVGDALLAEHARLDGLFKVKFPTGGVAAVVLPPAKDADKAAGPPAAFLARVRPLTA